jgi:SRSO17 transposase
MDAKQIRRLGPLLNRYLARFDDCFARVDTRAHLPVYVRGQLSDLPRKSVEPMALAAGVPPRTLQQFLSLLEWNRERMIDSVQGLVANEHASPHSVGIIDETGCPKKGAKTPGVQRQYCGATGKIENCVVTVHLGYAVDDFHCLLDSELYLPESWAEHRERCRAAGIPDTVGYRPKWRIALELLDRARANGVAFAWLTFDEWYGGKPEFLREVHRRRQRYVAEVPTNFMGWLKPPRLKPRPRALRVNRAASSVADLARFSRKLRDKPWQRFRVKDGQKGPMVWEAKQVRLFPQTEEGDPGWPVHLLIARNVLNPDEVKYFISNAPPKTSLATLLLVAFSRWHVERCFEDEKTELGFDHYEGRNYLGLLRHQAVTAVTHLFLARVREAWRGEKPGVHRLPDSHGGLRSGQILVAKSSPGSETAGPYGRDVDLPTTPERQGAPQPHEADTPALASVRHSIDRLTTVPMESELEVAL